MNVEGGGPLEGFFVGLNALASVLLIALHWLAAFLHWLLAVLPHHSR